MMLFQLLLVLLPSLIMNNSLVDTLLKFFSQLSDPSEIVIGFARVIPAQVACTGLN